jgi:hypothetical protein
VEWTGARYADMPTVEVSTWIEAPPEHVWPLVSDIRLIPGLSRELQSVEWLGGVSQPAVGAIPRAQQARCAGRAVHHVPHRPARPVPGVRMGGGGSGATERDVAVHPASLAAIKALAEQA